MFKVVVERKVEKSLSKIPQKWRVRLAKAIDSLSTNPFHGKKLEGELEGLYSIRVWPYRIIYSINKKEIVIIVVAIGHRQGIYT